MKNTKVNAAQVWKQFEDVLAPKLNFSRTDRAIYSHLFRHSRLEGKLKFRFSIAWLARGVSLSMKATRGACWVWSNGTADRSTWCGCVCR